MLLATFLLRITVLTLAGVPVPHADIWCIEQMSVTDSHGRMVCEVEPGATRIQIHKAGFADWDGLIDANPQQPNATIYLRPRGSHLELFVTPRISSEPASIFVEVLIEPQAVHRVIRVEAESGQSYRASEQQLEGLLGPRLVRFLWRDLEAGQYVLLAQVLDPARRPVAWDVTTFLILGRGI